MARASDLDLVTVDAFGTLLELDEPTDRLRQALAKRGVERDRDTVQAAFAAEVGYYLPRSHQGKDDASLAELRRNCARVFLSAANADLDPAEFAPDFAASLVFRPVAGATDALRRLAGAGLALACVTNWDISFETHLERVGLSRFFGVVVTSAEAGTPKPDAEIFRLVLRRVGIAAGRALHVGDSDSDRIAAETAGIAFEPVPLSTLPARLGL